MPFKRIGKVLGLAVNEIRQIRRFKVLSLAFQQMWRPELRLKLVATIFLLLLSGFMHVLAPWVGRFLIDSLTLLSQGHAIFSPTMPFVGKVTPLSWVYILALATCITGFLWYFFWNLATLYARVIAYQSQHQLRSSIFEHILYLGMDRHSAQDSRDTVKKILDGSQTLQTFLYGSFFRDIVPNLINMTVVSAALILMDWRLFFFVTLTLMISIAVNLVYGNYIQTIEQQVWNSSLKLSRRSHDVLTGIREVKAYRHEQTEAARMRAESEQQVLNLWKTGKMYRVLTTAESAWKEAWLFIALVIVIIPRLLSGSFTIGQVSQFLAYYGILYSNYMVLLWAYRHCNSAVIVLSEIKKFHSYKPNIVVRPSAKPVASIKHGLSLENVSFRYPSLDQPGLSKQVLKNININFPVNQMTALVGQSGAGKSTILSLLLRYYDPDSGRITVDDQDFRDLDLKSLRGKFAYLSQNPMLFSESIAQNISYSKPSASFEEIVAAAKSASAYDFIMEFPEGFDSEVGESGKLLSGGQKQRLALARALLSDAEVVILDEPTANLDPIIAKELMLLFRQALADRTVILVTHRISEMRKADQLILLKDGRIEGVGTFRKLRANCSHFRDIIEAEDRTIITSSSH